MLALTLAVMLAALLIVPAAGPAAAADPAAPSSCIAEVEGLSPHGTAVGRDAVLMLHGWTGSPDVWLGDISRTVNQTNEPIGRSLAEQVKRFHDTDVWLLDYHDVSTRWVTDSAVGGTVATAIDCLADAYGRPIGIMAHSMGGLAVRQVASQEERAERIAGVVTFGTPHAGSDLALTLAAALGLTSEPSALDLVKPIHTQFLRSCGWLTSVSAGACGPLGKPVMAFDSEAGRALRTGSVELDDLPPWPADLPTHSLAGELVIARQASTGLFYQDLGQDRLGDVIVSSSSATAEGTSSRSWECRHNFRIGYAPGEDVERLLGTHHDDGSERGALSSYTSSCLHFHLTETLEITNEALWFLHEQLKGGGSTDDAPADESGNVLDVDRERPPGSPMMIVLDVSDSMREDDGQGTVRIDGARSALADMLYALPDGVPLGVRTYPDSGWTGSCSQGRTLQPVEALDATRTTALIDGVTTDGDTPTGPALAAAVEELRAAGYDSGEILLVSDGESNCGDPPCDVAQSIVDDGFDLSADTLGFQTSAEGEQELQCISNVTRGRYFDADDSDELTERMVALSGGALEVDVEHAPSVPAGLRLPIEVTVTNAGGRTAEDVQITIGFEDQDVVPSVRPPRYRLGNIPAGGSVTRTWEVVAGSADDAGRAVARLTASGPAVQAVSRTVEFDVTEGLPRADEAGELLSQIYERGGRVAILGDSFSSGEGSGDYHPATDEPANRCHRSEHTYAVSLFGADAVDILACSGAVIQDLYSPQADRENTPAQLWMLAAMDEPPDLALVTLGGNDIDFAGIVERCVRPGDCTNDRELVYETLRDVQLLIPSLERAYRGIAQALDGKGTVAVMAYPSLLPYAHSASCRGFTTNEVAFANRIARELNAVVARAVESVWQEGYDVLYVPQSAHAVRPSNTACHAEPYINPIDLLLGAAAEFSDWASGSLEDLADDRWPYFEIEQTSLTKELMHPNADGYRAMSHALLRWSQVTDVDPGGEDRPPTPSDRDIVEDVVGGPVDRMLRVELDANPGGQLGLDLRRGDGLEVAADGYAPGSNVTIVLESHRTALGSVRTDADGAVHTVVHVPTDTPVGAHTVTALGVGPGGQSHRPAALVEVRLPTPRWILPATIGAAASGLLAMAGIVRIWLWARQRRRDPT